MTTIRYVLGSACALVLAAGCGGYEGQQLPQGATTAAVVSPGASVVPTGGSSSTAVGPSRTASTPASQPTETIAPQTCTPSGRTGAVGFSADAKIRKPITSFRVTLTQGTTSQSAWTPADLTNPHGMPLVRGVVRNADFYIFYLGRAADQDAALRGSWHAKPKATMLIEALAGDGTSIYQQRSVFVFTVRAAASGACGEKPSLEFFTKLTKADQIAPIKK